MAWSPASLPSREEESRLHQRLLDDDPVAPAEVAGTYLRPLIAWLKKRNSSQVPEHFVEEAAGEAIVSLTKNPRSFDPLRSRAERPLFSYLTLSAQRDLQNLLKKEEAHWRGRESLESVELSPLARKHLSEDKDPSLPLQLREEAEKANREVLSRVKDGLGEEEVRVLDLMLDGERKTAVFAQALGKGHLPKKDQKVEVKRIKDMLKKRIERGNNGGAS
jgi:hypothetical protein